MLFKIGDFRYFSPIFVESGSCLGAGISRALEAGFTRIKSVELAENLYTHCKQKFQNNPEVELYLGKSEDRLQEMLEDIGRPVVIFLDAHPAGPGTAGHEECLKGNPEVFQHTILQKELEIIFNHRKDNLIIIDDQYDPDQSLFYMDFIKTQNPDYTFEFLDEHLAPSEPYFKNKVLVCKPS